MSPFLLSLALIAAAAVALMVLLFQVQRRHGDAGIVDVGWAGGLATAALLCAALGSGDPVTRWVMGLLAAAWGFRLAWHILTDRVIPGEEDGRYRRMKEHWGADAQRKMFWFYMAQALFVVIFAIPFAAVAQVTADGFGWQHAVAVAVLLIAVGGESLADRQLARFRQDPSNSGQTCKRGLWRYSRHPNYFFEWLHWFAYVALAVGSPWVWATLLGPVTMWVFLFKVTGIPHTEAQARRSRDDYAEYQRTTSAFIPWFPKES